MRPLGFQSLYGGAFNAASLARICSCSYGNLSSVSIQMLRITRDAGVPMSFMLDVVMTNFPVQKDFLPARRCHPRAINVVPL